MMKFLKNNWHSLALLLIMVSTGFLTFFAIGNEGYANEYYSAAVKSMLTSWHNFFFASFDPAGYVTVDKPALGLWLQAISAFIFGFHGWSVILPEALSTVISVALIYHLVQRFFGKAAGIMSAIAMGLTPILIAVSRTNNLDASLVMVLLFATWALIVAAERGSLKYLILSMALVGLGFNIKMLEAFMVLPAFYLVYFFTSNSKMLKRIIHLTAATVVLIVVSLSWAVIVDMTPADKRPYVGSSQHNSEIELALGYNGIQRVTGESGFGNGARNGRNDGNRNFQGNYAPPAGNFQNSQNSSTAQQNSSTRQNSSSKQTTQISSGNSNNSTNNNNSQMPQPPNGNNTDGQGGFGGPPDRNMNGGYGQRPDGNFDGGRFGGGPRFGNGNMRGGFGGHGGNMGGGGPGGTGENGQKGIFRIFNKQIGGQISWLLPMALFGLLALILRAFKKDETEKRKVVRYLLLWAGCMFPMIAFFSIGGFFHRYYLSMLAPSIAALSGIGIVELWKLYLERGWKWMLLPASLLATASIQCLMLSRYSEWRGFMIPVVGGLSLAAAAVLVIIRLTKKDYWGKTIKTTIAVGFAALLIAPAIWAATPLVYGSQTQLPIAGPELKSDNPGGNRNDGSINKKYNENTGTSALVKYLISKRKNEKYLVAVQDIGTAESIILETGEPVMAVGGFLGNDNILTVEKLKKMVEKGEIRYFEIGGRGLGSEITNWVESNGKAVDSSVWSGTSSNNGQNTDGRGWFGMNNNVTLYDLAPNKG